MCSIDDQREKMQSYCILFIICAIIKFISHVVKVITNFLKFFIITIKLNYFIEIILLKLGWNVCNFWRKFNKKITYIFSNYFDS